MARLGDTFKCVVIFSTHRKQKAYRALEGGGAWERIMTSRSLAVSVIACAALCAAPAVAQTFKTSAGDVTVSTVARGLEHPWSLAFMPDGQMLVTERPGRMRIVTRDGRLSPAVNGVPRVFVRGQAGLLDVLLDRDFTKNRTVYFSYAEPFNGGGRTAVARATLDAGETPGLADLKVIYRQYGPPSSGNHFGSRIVQASDGTLFITNGEHFTDRDMAQTLDNDLGKIVRITPDGEAPKDNPFVGKQGARPEIWSYGHRNPQGLAFNPADGKLWEQEHGRHGRRRDQHHPEGRQLRLAGRQLWPQLRRLGGR